MYYFCNMLLKKGKTEIKLFNDLRVIKYIKYNNMKPFELFGDIKLLQTAYIGYCKKFETDIDYLQSEKTILILGHVSNLFKRSFINADFVKEHETFKFYYSLFVNCFNEFYQIIMTRKNYNDNKAKIDLLLVEMQVQLNEMFKYIICLTEL